jgi:hypothetical protein
MTFGDIRRRLTQILKAAGHEGAHPDLIDDAVNQRYTAILDALSWRRQRVEGVLQLVAPYDTGTLSVTAGGSSVTLTGGTFTSSMTGRAIRVAGRNEYYEFTHSSGTTGTLDRGYEGATASGLSYSIFQTVYALPSKCRVLESIRSFDLGPLESQGRREFNETAGARQTFGTPLAYSRFMDTDGGSPAMMVELYPVPDAAIGLPFTYFTDDDEFGPTDTARSLVPWARPAALTHGALADILGWLKDYQGSEFHEEKYTAALAQIVRTEIQNEPVKRLRLPERFTRHRVDRAIGRRRLLD